MIEGSQALLQRQMETNRPFEGHETTPNGSEQVPNGQENLVPSNETKTKSPQQSKSHRRRTKTSKQVKITKTPIETPVHESTKEPLQETVEESQRPLETTPQMAPNNILEVTKENWVKSLWDKVCKANETTKNKGKAPIAKVDLDKKQAHVDMVTRYAKTQSNFLNKSKASIKKELPSFTSIQREMMTGC